MSKFRHYDPDRYDYANDKIAEMSWEEILNGAIELKTAYEQRILFRRKYKPKKEKTLAIPLEQNKEVYLPKDSLEEIEQYYQEKEKALSEGWYNFNRPDERNNTLPSR